jgi:ABC-type sugar transport system ATPase subunit
MRDPNAEAGSLSGGNQQKVVVAKLLAADVSLMAIEEPTQGVDIEGRAQVHQLLERYVEGGNSILLFSTDVDEVLTLADAIYVFRHGQLSQIVAAQELDKKTLISMISGGGITS